MRRLYVQQFIAELGRFKYCTLHEGVDTRPREWNDEQFASYVAKLAEQVEFTIIYDERLKQRFKSRTNIMDSIKC